MRQAKSAGDTSRAEGPELGELDDRGLPGWLAPVRDAANAVRPEQLSRYLPPESGGGRAASVLVLFGDSADGTQGEDGAAHGPDLLLTERAHSLRAHAGQAAFPGGALDPADGDPKGRGPLRAALREAEEETGLEPSGVRLFGVLPQLYLPVSDFVVTPVLGWWRQQSPVAPVDPAEVASVFRAPIRQLAEPANRVRLAHPSGHVGPAFTIRGHLVWGFTAGLIDRILHHSGWERPWEHARVVPLEQTQAGTRAES